MKPDFAILTPISVEWAAMCAILSQSETPPAARLPTKTGYVGNHLVVCIKSGKGQANTAAALQHVFDTWAPRWVLLIGIAGGFPEVGVHRGDIIVAKHVLGVDFGKLTDGKYVRRPEYDFSADVRLLGHSEVVVDDSDQRWRQHINIGRPDGAPVSQSNAHAGYVASGDKVVDDPSHSFFVEVRASLPEVHAVEMEGVGAGASVRLESTHRVVGFLMIRGISDEPGHANKSATSGSSQRTLWSKYASAAVAAFVKQFLLEFPYTASIDDPLSVEQRGEARGLPPKVTSRASFMLPVGRSRQIIGRREERARLRDYLELARQGHSQLVLVAGPSGIGKTRLIGAIAEEALAGNALVLTGHIDPHQAPYRPFLPFISAFREYLNSAQLPTVQAALVNAPDLPRLLPELRDLSRTTMISAVAAPYEERLRLFESVTQFLRSITPSAGLVLMIEDIQAADAGTIALLNHLARESQGLRILILGTYRDDEATSNEWVDDVVLELESKRLLVRVTLKQLGVEHTRALLSDILETEVPQEFGSVIFTATEGNPLFVEEVVRTLIEEGSLFKGENGWVFPSPADLRVPPTIRATVRIRLARLSAECRQALSHASVIGREFRPGPLSTLLRKGRGRVLRLLDEAVAAHVVDVSPPNDAVTYAFRNPLIVQALYESLGMYERTRLHSRMAAHLESAYEGATLEHSAEIAYHCARGALSSRSEMSRAVQYMTLAGDRASALCAYEDALTHYEEAVALLEDRGRKSESVFLWEKIGDLRARLLSRVEASEAYARAIAKWRALKNKDTASGLRLYSKVVAVTRWGVRHPDVIAFA
jgi:nucleoside phosphorylase/DNA polymerase III delta prime subunit